MKTTRGFTLIELLVVIAIIAVLMAVLMPGLNAAKKQATMARCLTNHRSLTAGWLMYADDNDGFLMSNGACYDVVLYFTEVTGSQIPKLSDYTIRWI